MNVQETLALISALKGAGAVHFKSQDFEITLNPGSESIDEFIVDPTNKTSPGVQENPVVQENKEATEKLKDLISTLKMDDTQLLNKIFPAGAE